MKTPNIIYEIAYANILEKMRKQSFIYIVLIIAIISIFFLPSTNGKFGALSFDGYRGIYNSSWVGAVMAILTSITISLFGFYLVNDSIERDNFTGVCKIIASSGVEKSQYIFGKCFGNIIILTLLTLVTFFMGIIIFLIRNESHAFILWEYVKPFLILTMPTILFISSLSILFEVFNMNSGLWRMVYFVIWVYFLSLMLRPNNFFDVIGGSHILFQIAQDIKSIFSDYKNGFTVFGSISTINTFVWNGFKISTIMLLSRLQWVFISGVLLFFSTIKFDKFNEDSKIKIRRKCQTTNALDNSFLKRTGITSINFSSYSKINFVNMVKEEIILSLKGQKKWLYIIALALIILSFCMNLENSLLFLVPILWIIPISVWSNMPVNEIKNNTYQIVYSTINYKPWSLLAKYIAGVIIALLMVIGILVNLILSCTWQYIYFIIIGAFFIPALSLFVGLWCNSEKLFEIIYIVIWYIGPINKVYGIDFTGSQIKFLSINEIYIGLIYITLSLVMILLALFRGRIRKVLV